MSKRIDSASRFIPASPAAVYRAFAAPEAMQQWLPPANMTATLLHFEFHEGGGYRMRLTYRDTADGRGKTTGDSDEVDVRFVRLIESQRIEQAVVFDSDDPAFSGTMRMTWTFEPSGSGTLVTVRAGDVPSGIRPEDHEAGLNSTLDNLAAFLDDRSR
jgi:uncharacterized protein YndB with AHSA1/START domain